MPETMTTYCDQRGCEADDGYGCTGHTTEVNHWLDVAREVMHLHESDDAESPLCLECGHSFPCKTQRLLHSEWCTDRRGTTMDRHATIPMPRHVDGLGWTTVRCDCGWTNGIWPSRDDAIRAHVAHDKRCDQQA